MAAETGARRRFGRTLHAGFYAVLLASTGRYVYFHGVSLHTAPRLTFAGLFAILYGLGTVAWARPGRPARVWLLVVVGYWTALTIAAPSFGWCAVPLCFLVLWLLPTRAALPVVGVLTVVAAYAQVILSRLPWDPSPALAPVAIAVMSTVTYWRLHHENTELVRTRDALAQSERAAGVLQERARLSQEIHDTIAQGLSSMHLLLNAADREWAVAPGRAREHVRQAATVARDNLAEARRFVHDLAPPALDDGSLADAVGRLCGGTAERSGMTVDFRVEGDCCPLGVDVEVALLRVAQGALANVVQHAKARAAVVTLTYLPGAVTLDVCDDGIGFDPAVPGPEWDGADRGFGLRAIRQRVAALGGTTAVESAPGEGTAVAVSVPVPAYELDGADR